MGVGGEENERESEEAPYYTSIDSSSFPLLPSPPSEGEERGVVMQTGRNPETWSVEHVFLLEK